MPVSGLSALGRGLAGVLRLPPGGAVRFVEMLRRLGRPGSSVTGLGFAALCRSFIVHDGAEGPKFSQALRKCAKTPRGVLLSKATVFSASVLGGKRYWEMTDTHSVRGVPCRKKGWGCAARAATGITAAERCYFARPRQGSLARGALQRNLRESPPRGTAGRCRSNRRTSAEIASERRISEVLPSGGGSL